MMKTAVKRKRIESIIREELSNFLREDEKKDKEMPPHAISKAAGEFKAAVSKSLKQAIKDSLDSFQKSVKKFDESGIPKIPDELIDKLAGISDGLNQMTLLLDKLEPVIGEIEGILDHMINNPGEYITKLEDNTYAKEYTPRESDKSQAPEQPKISV